MITKVTLRYFKLFKEQQFELLDNLILAGPNNAGKTTLLQAISVWNLVARKWLLEKGPKSGSKAEKKTGVNITRKDFSAVPLREMNLLWTDRSTGLLKAELPPDMDHPGAKRRIVIELEWNSNTKKKTIGFELTYQNKETIFARPAKDCSAEDIEILLEKNPIVHIPPFSGIGTEETKYDKAYQDLLIGQGKPGDILRNLLWELYDTKVYNKYLLQPSEANSWDRLVKDIKEIFDYQLLPPAYEGRPFIICEYKLDHHNELALKQSVELDIANAGSGFLQVLMLFCFFYARPASVLLLDEPDAHLHVILQKQVYDRIRDIARERSCQLIISTHSEVIIDSTSPDCILSFFNEPHLLCNDTERDQVREALKRLTSLDILLADQWQGIIYLEGNTDLNILREWAKILNHPSYNILKANPLWHNNKGRNPHEAKAHFFALRAVKGDMNGILILDGDNRSLPDRELLAEGLEISRWPRYEIENYLLHVEALQRFVGSLKLDLFNQSDIDRGMDYLKNELPPAVIRNPLADHDYLNSTPSSKSILPAFFKAAGIRIEKNEYYQIAEQMKPEEIHPDVLDKLDLINRIFSKIS